MTALTINDYYRHFNKLKLWNDIANQIINYGMQYGASNLSDYVDMNCGGIPEGDFEQVVDLNAPEQFISMYTQIAEDRFAFAVSALLSMNMQFMKPIGKFCSRVGRDMNLTGIDTLSKAFDAVQDFVLDGMPGQENKEITRNDDKIFEWVKTVENHKSSWDKVGFNVTFFYELEELFVNGLLEASGIQLKITDGKKFTLTWQN